MHGYIYLVKVFPCADGDYYKLGRTKNLENRLKQHGSAKIIMTMPCLHVDSTTIERDLLRQFRSCFAECRDHGREYFQGDVYEMVELVREHLHIRDKEGLDAVKTIRLTVADSALNRVVYPGLLSKWVYFFPHQQSVGVLEPPISRVLSRLRETGELYCDDELEWKCVMASLCEAEFHINVVGDWEDYALDADNKCVPMTRAQAKSAIRYWINHVF